MNLHNVDRMLTKEGEMNGEILRYMIAVERYLGRLLLLQEILEVK